MNFYSDQHDDRSRRSFFDMFWESDNNYGLLASKEPMMMVPMRHEFLPQLSSTDTRNRQMTPRKTGLSMKICLAGVIIGMITFGLFMVILYAYNTYSTEKGSTLFESFGSLPKPMTLVAPTEKLRSSSSPKSLSTAVKPLQFPKPQKVNSSCQKPRLVGYYKGWDGQVITDSQLQKLTHVIFKYIHINKNGTIKFKNNLEELKFFDLKRRVEQGKFGVKVMVSLKISEYSMANINAFINSITSFVHQNKLDGIEIDWKHPRPEDIPNQVIFIKNLREKLQSSLISITSSGTEWKYSIRMNIKTIIEYVDFMNIFSFGYYPSTGNLTGPPAPLFSGIGKYQGYNVDRTMKYFVCETGQPEKLNMGVPFYGQSWKNVNGLVDKKEEMWRYINSKGHYIPWRMLTGYDLKKAAWHKNAMVPYLWNSDQRTFLGFENEKSLEKKMVYVSKKKIGGIMIESIGDDDNQDSLLNALVENRKCQNDPANTVNYKC